VRILLDTQILLWWLARDRRLDRAAMQTIGDPSNHVFVSAASIWEVSIKRHRGRLDAPDDFVDYVDRERFQTLNVTARLGWRAGALPPHHRDPFDRLLVAQALSENLTLMTSDGGLGRYDVDILEV
jgi:PIN domain nuclease of toxin-antitoxin system